MKYNDKITLIKPDGKKYENISAMAQPDIVFIQDEKIPVEENDVIERTLPSGVIDRKIVIDPGYHGNHPGFPAYQCKIKSAQQMRTQPQNVVYNINGPNSRVNIQSTDNSMNSATITPDEVFVQLKKIITEQIENNQELLLKLSEMQESRGKSNFLEKYQNFITSAANHITLIAPMIPALTQML